MIMEKKDMNMEEEEMMEKKENMVIMQMMEIEKNKRGTATTATTAAPATTAVPAATAVLMQYRTWNTDLYACVLLLVSIIRHRCVNRAVYISCF